MPYRFFFYMASLYLTTGFFRLVAFAQEAGEKKVDGLVPYELEKAAQEGAVTLSHVGMTVLSFSKFVLSTGGVFATILIMIGGVQYIFGGITDNKEQGKKTMIYALTGVIVMTLAWFIVDFFLQTFTEE